MNDTEPNEVNRDFVYMKQKTFAISMEIKKIKKLKFLFQRNEKYLILGEVERELHY